MKRINMLRSLLSLILIIHTAYGADVEGTKDYPLVKRVTDSEIYFGRTMDFEQCKIALDKIEWSRKDRKIAPYKSATVEGKKWVNYYKLPEKMGVIETLRNYEQDLKEAGFEVLFHGSGDEIETLGFNNQIAKEILEMDRVIGKEEEKARWPFLHGDDKNAAYISAKKTTAQGDVYVSAYIIANKFDKWLTIPAGRTLVRLDVCEVKAREQRMELVKSDEMANQINLNGRVALYGILFDFDKASLSAESATTLTEIAKLLNEKPELRILVVGHSDASGSFEYNRTLSQKRAESVVAALVDKGVSSERLFPVGVAFASPVAANTTEDGKAKNRRVELVDMAGAKTK